MIYDDLKTVGHEAAVLEVEVEVEVDVGIGMLEREGSNIVVAAKEEEMHAADCGVVELCLAEGNNCFLVLYANWLKGAKAHDLAKEFFREFW